MKIVTIGNQKGGSGKTTTAAALTQAAIHTGRKVLAIDLDPQGNLSFCMGANANDAGAFELLTGTPAKKLIQEYPGGLHIIPASWNLATLKSYKGSARRLSAALQPLKGSYDLVIIDTPPTAGELQYNALQASTGLIIPLQADFFGLQGLYQMADTARQLQQTNPGLQILGVLFANYRGNTILARDMRNTIIEKAGEMGIPSLGEIRQGIAVQEAQTMQESLFEYAPKSNPAQDYTQLLEKIMEG